MSGLEVRCGSRGAPEWVLREAGWTRVEAVLEHWRVDVGWWRCDPERPVSRDCWRLLLSDGVCLQLRRERRSGSWALERIWG